MKIFLHVGFPKCGSTSLQQAMAKAIGVVYPKSGCKPPDAEHISLPLHLKGIDRWTSQFVSANWVATQHALMLEEVAAADLPVVISSERLAALNPAQIERLKQIFAGHEIEILIVHRDRMKYLDSTWRHAVFRHDYAGSWDDFLAHMKSFSFESIVPAFEQHFPVHMLNLDQADFTARMNALTGAELEFGAANVGVPRRLAELLQEQHARLGTRVFREIFTVGTKNKMLYMMTNPDKVVLAPFDVPLF